MERFNFFYTQKQIGSLSVLAKTLSITVNELNRLRANSDSYYQIAKRVVKADGSERITYDVKYPLKTILQKLRSRVIKNVQLPKYILAGRKGKSYLDNAMEHMSTKMIQSEDISNFFDSIKSKYVINVFKYLFKFPNDVAEALTDLCTFKGHLVQGSPVSGDIANLIFYHKEPQLVQAIESLGLKYTRYYDDIYVSSKEGNFYQHVSFLKAQIYGMFSSIQVKPNRSLSKSRVMRNSSRIDVHDVTVNSHKLSPSRKRVSNVRAQINKLKNSVNSRGCLSETISLFKSTLGQVNTLKAQGSPKAKDMLKNILDALKGIDEAQAKKYCRKARKVKELRQLNKLAQNLSVLKKVSPTIAGVANAELKQARERIKKKQ
ncbi:reverse transcriptase family protein [Pseudoalteromonas luteoviolacea]|uniref:reverse transcriptase family protein n=1 Tax=Pseudoalteromonas luteoviolacea TaxID=43657 RepID=UPI001B37F4B4|nr:RNA-directed DNA polymerase [Pseudoalteromonas luteoviolacea]